MSLLVNAPRARSLSLFRILYVQVYIRLDKIIVTKMLRYMRDVVKHAMPSLASRTSPRSPRCIFLKRQTAQYHQVIGHF